METTLKLYSQREIGIATFFGGPLAAGILIRQNYINLNKDKQGLYALIIGILSMVLIFVGIFSIPDNIFEKIPNSIFPFIYTGIIYLIVEKLQGFEIKRHKENGGEFYSGWKAAGVGTVSMIVLAAGIFGYVYASSIDDNFDTALYDKGIEKFIENEAKSILVFNVIETADDNYLLKEFSKGVVLWTENYSIIENISTIENLPDVLVVQNEKLLKYSNLRISQFELFVKSITENTDKYSQELKNLDTNINRIIEELN